MKITGEILKQICLYSGAGETAEVPFDDLLYVHQAAAKFKIGDDEVWIPFSQLEGIEDDHLIVSKWFADQEELPYD